MEDLIVFYSAFKTFLKFILTMKEKKITEEKKHVKKSDVSGVFDNTRTGHSLILLNLNVND